MRVVILAAGRGSRLGRSDVPKPLTPLDNGLTILGSQLAHLREVISLDQVKLVVGYQKEKFAEIYPDLTFVENPHFADENTSKSLLRALKGVDDDVLWMNGDVVFHPLILQKVMEKQHTCMVVNVGRVGEEEVKYVTNGKGVILGVSKLVSEPEGEALGINFVSRKDLSTLYTALESCQNADYFEKALEICIHTGMIVKTVPVEANLCTEVDFPEDLVHANNLIRQWRL